jgi:predicted AAA+ superfamily ATPase
MLPWKDLIERQQPPRAETVEEPEPPNPDERFFARAEALLARLEQWIPRERKAPDLGSAVAWRWIKRGQEGCLKPVRFLSASRLEDLRCIDRQKQAIQRNTRQFLAKLPANNVLLWGPRGTGKSSLIKALLNEYAAEGLRLIEVERQHLTDLPDIVELLHDRPERFVIFCDDLSFEAHDPSYKALKVILDGSVSSTPENVLVYATSNRRHLLPEQLSENLESRAIGGEIHQAEGIEEKLSLSERFGLWLAFHPFDQEAFLHIVFYWLGKFGVSPEDAESVRPEALQWALLHGSRSGRSAWQFARDWAGRKGLEELEPHD